MEIPQGNSREEVKLRDQIIKDFYAGWIAENPEKKMWNEDLQDYILVKYLSITETAEKAARQYESTLAVMRLSELLTKSKKVAEVPPKNGTKNQKPFLKMYIMQLDNIRRSPQVTRFSIVSLLYNNTATPKSGCYTLGLETDEVA